MKFKNLIDNIDVLNEEAKSSIQEAFESAVKTRVEERLQLEINKSLTDLDDKHAKQLNSLLEAVDKDHSQKFMQALTKQDKDHAAKLQQVVEHYEKALKTDAKALREDLEEDLSNFLDLYIEKLVPAQDIKKAVENTQATRIVESIKQIVAIDDKFITNNIKEALQDGKEKIDNLHAKLNETLKENIDLKRSMQKFKAKSLLEKKTEDLPAAKKQFVNKFLGNKSPEYIEENYNFVVEMFERDEDDAPRRVLNESSTNPKHRQRRRMVNESIDTPKNIVEEKAASHSPVNGYLEALKEINK
jgi:hypothetical protein